MLIRRRLLRRDMCVYLGVFLAFETAVAASRDRAIVFLSWNDSRATCWFDCNLTNS